MRALATATLLSLLLHPTLADARGTGGLSPEATRLIRASGSAPRYLVRGNMPRNFRPQHREKVRPGTTAFIGKDARGKQVWVVDHRSTYRKGPKDIASRLLDGFFCGACAGKKGNGPRMKVVALKKGGKWIEPGTRAHGRLGALKSPLTDKAADKIIVEVAGVRPVPNSDAVLAPAKFQMVIHRSSIKAGKDLAEFTGHFLNPDKLRGPFPGTTDGALRVRARRNGDGSISLEEFYVTRGASEFVEPMARSVKPMATGRRLFNMGRSLLEKTPAGFMMKPVTSLSIRAARGMADTALRHTAGKQVFSQVAKLHTGYWEDVMFKNLRE